MNDCGLIVLCSDGFWIGDFVAERESDLSN